jgi:hypothetical protein
MKTCGDVELERTDNAKIYPCCRSSTSTSEDKIEASATDRALGVRTYRDSAKYKRADVWSPSPIPVASERSPAMTLGQENVLIQDASDLNETVVQSFPAHPRVSP